MPVCGKGVRDDVSDGEDGHFVKRLKQLSA